MQGQIDNYLIIYIIITRILELILSNKNTKTLLSRGGVEHFSSHYKFIVFFHVVFILYFLVASVSFKGLNLEAFYIFLFIQICRFKIIFDLGKYWTTRIIVLKNEPLIKTGFYKYIKHPNYIIVITEIILVCLIFRDYFALIFFTVIKAVLLLIRIYFEDKANSVRRKKFSV